MRNPLAKILFGACSGVLFLILMGGSPARQPGVLIRGVTADPVLAFAADELAHFLGPRYSVDRNGAASDAAWIIDLGVDKAMEDFSFSVQTTATSGGGRAIIELRGPNAVGVLHAAYTLLEKAGIRFDIGGPINPDAVSLDNLRGFSRVVRPAVSRRGIRQHINFAMDISSYPIEEAKGYLRGLARLRMNSITFHSYPGQWYPDPLKEGTSLAGNFFYGQRHDIPDDPLFKSVIRNQKVYCIPAIEPYYDQPEEKSRRAMDWLGEVIQEAKRVGLTVNFSMELRENNPALSLASCRFVIKRYPWIDALELISQENSDKSGGEIEYNAKILGALRGKDAPGRKLDYGAGIYSTGIEDLKPGFEKLRRITPPDVHLTVLPSHGARKAVENLKAIPITAADVSRTMFYSWVEFDGLMYLQQNPVEGIRRLIEEGKRLSGGAPMYGVGWNHWRTAENRTAIAYAAAAMIEGPIAPRDFYRDYGRALGIGDLEAYGAAMGALDDADTGARDELFNIGFCWGGYWTSPKGLANYGEYAPDKIEAAIRNFGAARDGLARCVPGTPTAGGKRYLEFLTNRISCTLLHLRAFLKMTELQPLFAGKNPKPLTAEDRRRIGAVSAEALALETEYMKLHAQMILDRGCEGTLISYNGGPVHLLKQILKAYAGETGDAGLAPKAPDAPPAPAGKK